MADPWLPIGFRLSCGAVAGPIVFSADAWQISAADEGGRTLIVTDELAQKWISGGLADRASLQAFQFGARTYHSLSCQPDQMLAPVAECRAPDSKAEALAFALALQATRRIDQSAGLQDAIYVEKISRLLPTYGISSRTADDVVLGYWLTGGAPISVKSFRRLRETLSWLGTDHLKEIVAVAGFKPRNVDGPVEPAPRAAMTASSNEPRAPASTQPRTFDLPGRESLAGFFNEHVVDIVMNRERYRALGIDFPSAVILHGPPGTGKTFAVEKLVEFLGWPSFAIDASSVASPYIHETSKKVAQVFERAIEHAPAVLIIDEMEAFLADREMGTGHHRVEEVAEFLRRIPEASRAEVLVIGMTNRLDMIDTAIRRRGRFDHVIAVDFASEAEVQTLLNSLIAALPTEDDVDTKALASELSGRPLSDVAFVVREGARLAARAGRDRLSQASLLEALKNSPARDQEGAGPKRRIGFV